MKNLVAILDFGSQYTQLIARRVREAGVYSEIYPCNITFEKLSRKKPKAIILSGGPATVRKAKSPVCDKRIFALGVPVLGICYGMQLMAKLLGGKVISAPRREYGKADLFIDKPDALFSCVNKKITAWMSHGDSLSRLPKGFLALAHSRNSRIAAMGDTRRKFYGLQFHPEVIHTPRGKRIIRNFLFKVTGLSPDWTMKSFIENTLSSIKTRVGREKVLCALSGGVDSSVLSVLLARALGRKVIIFFVDNGLLRKNEARYVIDILKKKYKMKVDIIDARDKFLKALKGVSEPEKKRKIIGREFIRVFEEEVKQHGEVRFLAQGTLYPDVIESRSAWGGPSATIKTHHNVGGLPKRMKFKLIEPFRELFKDEVRRVGKELGLPEEIIWRHPFPGPGLAVRIVGCVTEERLRVLREVDDIFVEEIKKAGLYRKIWQALAVLLPIKSVGVMGDERTYENVAALRAVTSTDGMTADWFRFPPKVLSEVSRRIVNEIKGVNRVVYDVSSKPPSTIEWE